MRLAYLSTDRGVLWGGAKEASVHLAEMARALAAQGSELLLLVAGVEKDAPPPPPGVRLELLSRPGKGPGEVKRLAAEPMRTAWIVRRLERFGAEALYERIALHSAAGSAAASALGIPHLVELNAPLAEEAARYRRLERRDAAVRLERTVLQNADLVLVVTRPLADYARACGARRVKVCPKAVSGHDLASPRHIWQRRAGDVIQAACGLAEFQVALARPVAGGPRVTAGGASRKRPRTFDPYLSKAPKLGET
jgi:hypothetical protein